MRNELSCNNWSSKGPIDRRLLKIQSKFETLSVFIVGDNCILRIV